MKLKKGIALCLAVLLSLSFLTACRRSTLDNETSAFVMATDPLDGVFNPFFSSTAPDAGVIGMTQISMLSADKKGENPTFGEGEAVLALDYQREVLRRGQIDMATEYTFVLKNNVKFSDGVSVSIKDVLFNLYVYLDPVYTGSATIYSTPIQGLAAFRAQSEDRNTQLNFDARFRTEANTRMLALRTAIGALYPQGGAQLSTPWWTPPLDPNNSENPDLTAAIAAGGALAANSPINLLRTGLSGQQRADFDSAVVWFLEELNNDYDNTTLPEGGRFTTIPHQFLYNYGMIKVENGEIKWGGYDIFTDKESAVRVVYENVIRRGFHQELPYTQAGSRLNTQFIEDAISAYFAGSQTIPNISGIKSSYHPADGLQNGVTVNGKTYAAPVYQDGNLQSGYEVLRITIDGIDPRAHWNFAISVAPMHYYSDAERIGKFDGYQNFGVEFGDADFFRDVLRGGDKVGVPMGAGPYKASNKEFADLPVTQIRRGDFWYNNVVHYVRNEHFLMGSPVINRMAYQVIDKSLALDALKKEEIHFAQLDARKQNIDPVEANKNLDYYRTDMLGYGYIGINAAKVPEMGVRRAVMYAMNTSLAATVYYDGYASVLDRPMSQVSWAYPKDPAPTARYPYDASGAASEAALRTVGGNIKKENGKWTRNGRPLSFNFTIAGESLTEHPAYNIFAQAKNVLESIGCEVKITPDAFALTKLAGGGLEIWAAAWGQSLDPDMFQVYHRNSKASSVLSWGYDRILTNPGIYGTEIGIINALSAKIDDARDVETMAERIPIYRDALDLVMDLAVELPTYQRQNVFIYNKRFLDPKSLPASADVTPFQDPLAKIWELKFK